MAKKIIRKLAVLAVREQKNWKPKKALLLGIFICFCAMHLSADYTSLIWTTANVGYVKKKWGGGQSNFQ